MIKTDLKTQTIALLKGYGPFSNREKQDAIENAIMWAALYNGGRCHPGEAYDKLPQEIKNALKDCKSKDWNHRIKS